MDKIKITEIKERRKIKRRERNKEGKLVDVEKTIVITKEVPYVHGWLRFGHYLIDYICYLAIRFVLTSVIGTLYYTFCDVTEEGLSGLELFLTFFSLLILYPGYYMLFEGSVQRTPGKFITGVIVVNEYGEKPSPGQIFGRSFARLVPFEALSCLGTKGWHDNWSETFIIKVKDLEEMKTLVKLENYLQEPITTELK